MIDVNEAMLEQHLNNQEDKENALDRFFEETDDDMQVIIEMIKTLKLKAIDYDEYDFSEELDEMLEETLC